MHVGRLALFQLLGSFAIAVLKKRLLTITLSNATGAFWVSFDVKSPVQREILDRALGREASPELVGNGRLRTCSTRGLSNMAPGVER